MRYLCLCIAAILGACSPSAGSMTLPTPTVQNPEINEMNTTAVFANETGMGGYPAITLEQIGDIPADTRVNISTYTYQDGWLYTIVDVDGNYVEARESQLAFAPNVTPGAPTPTAGFSEFTNQGTVYARTLNDVGNIPAGTRVQIGGGYYGDGEWIYLVGNEELGLSGEVPESQLEIIEVVPYNFATEVPSQTP